MATAEHYAPRDIELSETDLEKKVGDYLFRCRQAEKIVNMDIGESRNYGPLTVKRKEREFLVSGVDGIRMEPIPHFGFEPDAMAAVLDHKIETNLSQL